MALTNKMKLTPNLTKDEIYNLYLKGYSLKVIASMLLKNSDLFTPKSARTYVEKVIMEIQKKENSIVK